MTFITFVLKDVFKMCVYRCSKLRCSYGGTGTVQLHTTSQVKITDLHRRHLQTQTHVQILLTQYVLEYNRNTDVFKPVMMKILAWGGSHPTQPHPCTFPNIVTTWK